MYQVGIQKYFFRFLRETKFRRFLIRENPKKIPKIHLFEKKNSCCGKIGTDMKQMHWGIALRCLLFEHFQIIIILFSELMLESEKEEQTRDSSKYLQGNVRIRILFKI